MTSTYSPNLALELIGTGDQPGTWGTTTNNNMGTLLEQAISGYTTQAITDGADTVLTMSNGASCTARNMVIELTGALTAARTLIVPNNKKLYFIYNNTSGGFGVTVKTAAGAGVLVRNGQRVALLCNSTNNVVAAVNSLVAPATVTSSGPSTVLQVTQQSGTGTALSVTGTSVISANDATTPALRVTQVGDGHALLVEDDTNPDSTPFIITKDGYVFIGANTSVANPTPFSAVSQINAFIGQQLTFGSANTAGPIQYFQKSRLVAGSPSVVTTGDTLGGLLFAGWDAGTPTGEMRNAVAITAECTGTIGANSVPGQISLQVTPNLGSAYVQQMIINGAGVGIGTTAPSVANAITFNINKSLGSSATANLYSIVVDNVIQDNTSHTYTSATTFRSFPSTQASSLAVTNYYHFTAENITLGAGTTLAYQVGFTVGALSSATDNVGFVSNIAAGAANANFYAAGTAPNKFNGKVLSLGTGANSGIGYGTGAGSTVLQTGTRDSGVTINAICGQITLVNVLSVVGYNNIIVTNSTVAATDVVIVNFGSGATSNRYNLCVTQVSAGSFRIQIQNIQAITEQPIINFAVIKGVTA